MENQSLEIQVSSATREMASAFKEIRKIERERETELGGRERENGARTHTHMNMYIIHMITHIYIERGTDIYIYVYIEREEGQIYINIENKQHSFRSTRQFQDQFARFHTCTSYHDRPIAISHVSNFQRFAGNVTNGNSNRVSRKRPNVHKIVCP